MKRSARSLFFLLILCLFNPGMPWHARGSRTSPFEASARNQLLGYGLVVGLNGTGDRIATRPSPSSRSGDAGSPGRAEENDLRTARAAVMVTATLPP